MSSPPPMPLSCPPAEGLPGLADKIAYLGSLCGAGDEAIETHFAWIFLIGDRALKLRKPVRRDTMDYLTVDARRIDSENDVSLNRRLAPRVYLRNLPMMRRADGRLALGGDGEIVDWLVEMRRLDRRQFMDAALGRDNVPPAMLLQVADVLARFYASAASAISLPGMLGPRLAAQAAANGRVLNDLDATRSTNLAQLQRRALARLEQTFDARVAAGCVVEGHGDLRPEHILLDSPPAIIDCLEFDRDLRIMDRAEELCVLEIECARIGHADTGRWILSECLKSLSDDPPAALLDFYRSHRAAHRAKLYTWRAAEPDGDTPEGWRARAGKYLDAAIEAATRAAA